MKQLPIAVLITITLLIISAFIYIYVTSSTDQNTRAVKSEKISIPKDNDFEIVFETESVDLPAKPPWVQYGEKSFYPKMNYFVADEDIWITEITPIVEGAPAEVLHHGTIYFQNDYQKYCNDSHQIFYSSSKEMIPVSTPKWYGYFIPKGTTLKSDMHWIHFRNDTEKSFQNVKYKVIAKATKDNTKNLKSANIFWLNIECSEINEYIFPVPPNEIFTTSLKEPYVATEDFEMAALFSHVHDYGKNMKFKINGEAIWTFYPVIENEIIKTIPPYYPQKPIKVKKSDVLDIEVTYENPTENVSEGMGMFAALIYKE